MNDFSIGDAIASGRGIVQGASRLPVARDRDDALVRARSRPRPARRGAPPRCCRRTVWPSSVVSAPPASCTIRSAAARSQSWLSFDANAISSLPAATRVSRSASECTFGSAIMPGADFSSSPIIGFGPATCAPAKPRPCSPGSARRRASRLRPRPRDRDRPPRGEHRGRDRAAVLDQRDRDRPVGAAGHVGARAVDRIDDPQPRSGRAARGRPRSPRRASRNPAPAA